MKKSIGLLLGLILTGSLIQAQNLYLRLGPGIALGTSSSMEYSYDQSGSSNMVYSKKLCYGTGLPLTLGAGYYLGEYVGIELGINYFIGFSGKYYDKDTYSDYNYKRKGTMLSLVPALVVRIPMDKVSPYARLGLMVGIMNGIVSEIDMIDYDSPQKASITSFVKTKESGGIAIGGQSALGIDFKLSSLLGIYAEIQMSGITYSPSKGEIKEYTEDGKDMIGNLTTREKEWKYLKEVDNTKNIPDGSPNEMPKVSYPFNNVGLSVGVKINL